MRAFYLGEGLQALGRHSEAAPAYERTMKEHPEGRYAARAKVSLGGMTAYRS